MQHNNSPMFPSGASQQGSVVWFISFGDLLTLLLCFFLVLTPWNRLNPINQSEVKQVLSPRGGEDASSGTGFARTKDRERLVVLAEFPIFQHSLAGQDNSDFRSLRQMIASEAPSVLREARSVAIRLCDRSVDRARLIAQVGALIEQQAERNVSMRIELSSGCEGFEFFRPVSAEVVGVVSIRGA